MSDRGGRNTQDLQVGAHLDSLPAYLRPGDLVIMCGLPLTGKTTVAKRISSAMGFPVVRTDLVRQEVLAGQDVFDERVASDMTRRMAVYKETLRRTEEALERSTGAVIDATFITKSLRAQAAGIARTHSRWLIIVETRCPRNVALARLRRRAEAAYESNAVTEQAYVNNELLFEPVDLVGLARSFPDLDTMHLIVDTRSDSVGDWTIVSVDIGPQSGT